MRVEYFLVETSRKPSVPTDVVTSTLTPSKNTSEIKLHLAQLAVYHLSRNTDQNFNSTVPCLSGQEESLEAFFAR